MQKVGIKIKKIYQTESKEEQELFMEQLMWFNRIYENRAGFVLSYNNLEINIQSKYISHDMALLTAQSYYDALLEFLEQRERINYCKIECPVSL